MLRETVVDPDAWTRFSAALGATADPQTPTPSALLRVAERRTLDAAKRPHGRLAGTLFRTLDLVYGRASTLSKFVVLELVARVPYQAWENVGYVAISHTSTSPHFARRIFDYVRESRAQQDNEQWHLLILQELVGQPQGVRGWFLFRAIPQLLAFFYYHVSWLLYVLLPRWSYELNADFEDHAERAYMGYVHAHPEVDEWPWQSAFVTDYGAYATVGDVLRRIALDERVHRDESLARIAEARFHENDGERSAMLPT
ncbi:MAG: alternative oxidase [Polyangiaceae bacterium]